MKKQVIATKLFTPININGKDIRIDEQINKWLMNDHQYDLWKRWKKPPEYEYPDNSEVIDIKFATDEDGFYALVIYKYQVDIEEPNAT